MFHSFVHVKSDGSSFLTNEKRALERDIKTLTVKLQKLLDPLSSFVGKDTSAGWWCNKYSVWNILKPWRWSEVSTQVKSPGRCVEGTTSMITLQLNPFHCHILVGLHIIKLWLSATFSRNWSCCFCLVFFFFAFYLTSPWLLRAFSKLAEKINSNYLLVHTVCSLHSSLLEYEEHTQGFNLSWTGQTVTVWRKAYNIKWCINFVFRERSWVFVTGFYRDLYRPAFSKKLVLLLAILLSAHDATWCEHRLNLPACLGEEPLCFTCFIHDTVRNDITDL